MVSNYIQASKPQSPRIFPLHHLCVQYVVSKWKLLEKPYPAELAKIKKDILETKAQILSQLKNHGLDHYNVFLGRERFFFAINSLNGLDYNSDRWYGPSN